MTEKNRLAWLEAENKQLKKDLRDSKARYKALFGRVVDSIRLTATTN